MKSISIIPRKNLGRIIRKAIQDPVFAYNSFRRRILSFLTYKFADGYSAFPETISLFLTRRCNLKCGMCGQWGERGVFRNYSPDILKQQLELPTIKKLLRECKQYQPTITLFGGEPMLHPDWLNIVRAAKENGLRCNIVTNAVLLQQHVNEIVDSGLDEIIFSLDGPREVHDSSRGVPGTFDRAMEGFARLREIKEHRGQKKPFVTINTTINQYSHHCLTEIAEIAERIGAYHLNLHHLLFLSQGTCERHDKFFRQRFGMPSPDWFGFVHDTLPALDLDVLFREMDKIRQRQSGVSVSFYPNFEEDEIRKYYTEWEFESKSYANRCLSPWMVAYIFPDGSVRPYHSMDYEPGNVLTESFTKIWNNQQYREYRRVVKEIGKFEVCSKGCTELYRY